jgi:hypothetical protein
MVENVTANGVRAFLRRQHERSERDRKAWRESHKAVVQDRQQVPDADLIANAPGIPGPQYEMEMQRRLKAAVVELTGELVKFRRASDEAASRMERLTRWLIGFTIALTVLTVVVAILTAALLAKG